MAVFCAVLILPGPSRASAPTPMIAANPAGDRSRSDSNVSVESCTRTNLSQRSMKCAYSCRASLSGQIAKSTKARLRAGREPTESRRTDSIASEGGTMISSTLSAVASECDGNTACVGSGEFAVDSPGPLAVDRRRRKGATRCSEARGSSEGRAGGDESDRRSCGLLLPELGFSWSGRIAVAGLTLDRVDMTCWPDDVYCSLLDLEMSLTFVRDQV